MYTHLVWFRSDLRIHDNLALEAACHNQSARVIGLFIATPYQWRMHAMAPRQAAFLHVHLNALQHSLSSKGIPLFYSQVDDFDTQIILIKKICEEERVTHLFYNYQYELNERRRDITLERSLTNKVICSGFDDSVILQPGSVMNKNHEMYKIFTPFKNAWIKRVKEEIPVCVSVPAKRKCGALNKSISNLNFDYPQVNFMTSLFPSSEQEALMKLRTFCKSTVVLYEKQRDFPWLEGTSRLSACLACGILSPRQCLHQLLLNCPQALNGSDGASWLNELIWREFYRHLINFYPKLCKSHPFISWTNNICWKQNDLMFNMWKQGKTGYPIVDAAMRQLNTTGWMHNRLRMITANFLVKHLLIDWRYGERYFISQLVDGDLASNNGGWQWAASTGTDAMPYFRIFNPIKQGKKFDANGKFIRQWIPELSNVPDYAIHNPWIWAETSGTYLDYPHQIIDYQKVRTSALEVYKAARSSYKMNFGRVNDNEK